MERKLIAPHKTRRRHHLSLKNAVYAAAVFLSFHYYFVIYINSSALARFAPPQFINVLYILSAALSIFLFFLIPRIIAKYGSYRVILGLILVEMAAVIGLGLSWNLATITAFFIVYESLPPLLLFCLDIFLEKCSRNETTGRTRSFYMTIGNVIIVICPAIVGWIVSKAGFSAVYFSAFLFLIPLFLIALSEFKQSRPIAPHELRHISLSEIFHRREVGIIFTTEFLLQFFYATMTIYMPLYLFQKIGMSWEHIGLVFTIMLIPFVLLEIPLGRLADKKIGEKEILITGFIIAAASTLVIPSLATSAILPWALLLFSTRIGASFIEIANETYFFKQVRSNDTNLISLYRNNIPLSYIAAPLAAGIVLVFLPEQAIFTMLGIALIVGVAVASQLIDTL